MRQNVRTIVALAGIGILAQAAAAGCGKLTATTQAVSMVTHMPALKEAQGWDAKLDAAMPANASLFNITVAAVGGTSRDGITSTTVTPLTGADASVVFTGSKGSTTVHLCEVPSSTSGTGGTYRAVSVPDSLNCGTTTLEYVNNVNYTTNIETGSDLFTLHVAAPEPINPALVDFTKPLTAASLTVLTLKHHALGEGLGVDWSRDTTASDKRTIASLFRVNYTGTSTGMLTQTNWQLDPKNPIFDNAPRKAGDMIDFVTKSPSTSLTIDGAYFGQKGLYILVLTATNLNTTTSDNLSLGSGALAGSGTAFAFYVD
jgi:hypothetical protein